MKVKLKHGFTTLICCFLVFFPVYISPGIIHFIQVHYYKDASSLVIIPEHFSGHFSGGMFVLACLLFYTIYINIDELKRKKTNKKPSSQDLRKAIIALSLMNVVFLLLVYAVIGFSGNYIEIFKDRINLHNGFLVKNKSYAYRQIVGIEISYFKGVNFWCIPEYNLEMDDRKKLNIAADGIYPKLFMAIDRLLPSTIKRKCTPGGKMHVIDKMPGEFFDYYYDNYLRDK